MPMAIGWPGHVGQGIGASGHCLGPQGLHRPAARHFGPYHCGYVHLQPQVVHQPESPLLTDQAQPAAIGLAIDQQG